MWPWGTPVRHFLEKKWPGRPPVWERPWTFFFRNIDPWKIPSSTIFLGKSWAGKLLLQNLSSTRTALKFETFFLKTCTCKGFFQNCQNWSGRIFFSPKIALNNPNSGTILKLVRDFFQKLPLKNPQFDIFSKKSRSGTILKLYKGFFGQNGRTTPKKFLGVVLEACKEQTIRGDRKISVKCWQ